MDLTFQRNSAKKKNQIKKKRFEMCKQVAKSKGLKQSQIQVDPLQSANIISPGNSFYRRHNNNNNQNQDHLINSQDRSRPNSAGLQEKLENRRERLQRQKQHSNISISVEEEQKTTQSPTSYMIKKGDKKSNALASIRNKFKDKSPRRQISPKSQQSNQISEFNIDGTYQPRQDTDNEEELKEERKDDVNPQLSGRGHTDNNLISPSSLYFGKNRINIQQDESPNHSRNYDPNSVNISTGQFNNIESHENNDNSIIKSNVYAQQIKQCLNSPKTIETPKFDSNTIQGILTKDQIIQAMKNSQNKHLKKPSIDLGSRSHSQTSQILDEETGGMSALQSNIVSDDQRSHQNINIGNQTSNNEEEKDFDQPNDKFCRICKDDENEGKLIQPCDCQGSIAHVHNSCLKQWVARKSQIAKNGRGSYQSFINSLACEICQSVYSVKFYRQLAYQELKQNQKKFSTFKWTLAALLIISLLLGCSIYGMFSTIDKIELLFFSVFGFVVFLSIKGCLISSIYQDLYSKQWRFVDKDNRQLGELRIKQLEREIEQEQEELLRNLVYIFDD